MTVSPSDTPHTKPIVISCAQCAQPFQIPKPGDYACPTCNTQHAISPSDFDGLVASQSDTSTAEKLTANDDSALRHTTWMDPVKRLSLSDYLYMIRDILLNPQYFFNNLPNTAISFPLGFGMVCYFIGTLFQVFYQVVLGSTTTTFLNNYFNIEISPTSFIVWGVLFSPFIYIITVYFMASVYYVAMILVMIYGRTYASVLLVAAYAIGTCHLLNVIPMLGGWLSQVWTILVTVTGIRIITRLNSFQAFMVVLLPILISLIFSMILLTKVV